MHRSNDSLSNSLSDARARARAIPMERDASEAMPYLESAVPVGLAGAAVVAVFVFGLDVVAGRPLATPNALGAAIFRGEAFSLNAPIQTVSVFGYSLLHSVLCVIMATAAITAEYTWTRQGLSKLTQFAIGTPLLFLSLQAGFMTLALLLDIDWVSEFGLKRLLATNALAAITMSTVLYYRRRDENA